MKVAAYLLASLSLSVALPAQNFSWNEVKGVNLILKPASNDYAVVDEPNNGRIIGGNESVPHSKPYQVGLLINGESFCSGSLISTSFVITAAHCVAGASFVELIFGAHNINIQEASQVRVTSRNIFSNPGYTALYPHNNDIALIKTPTPIVPNNYIQTITLAPEKAGPYRGFLAVLSGWGTTSESSTGISTTLREVLTVVLKETDCYQILGPNYSDYSNLCTSGSGPKGGCNGDSGAPLVVGDLLIGVLSFITSEGCESSQPTGFTRISPYRPWINYIAGL